MNITKLTRASKIASIFLREQLREPISLLWTLISPCVLFYFFTHNIPTGMRNEDYIQATAGFYAYIACTVAFFGVALYIIGRRESGFIRSFIYTPEAKAIFLTSHIICYFIAAIVYCITFYIITKPSFGQYSIIEIVEILYKFLTCFVIFCTPALYLANCRLNFQSANTVISILIFTITLLALLTPRTQSKFLETVNTINVYAISKKIMTGSISLEPPLFISSLVFTATLSLTSRKLRINPVWSRY